MLLLLFVIVSVVVCRLNAQFPIDSTREPELISRTTITRPKITRLSRCCVVDAVVVRDVCCLLSVGGVFVAVVAVCYCFCCCLSAERPISNRFNQRAGTDLADNNY